MAPLYTGGRFCEVDFDTCIVEIERLHGSQPGDAPMPGEKLRCLTHGLVIVQHQPKYFQAAETCAMAALAHPRQRPRRATRATEHLTANDIVKLYLAVLRANLRDMTLTYFATISWTTLGLDDDAQIQAATQALFVRLREWSQRKVDGASGAPMPIPLAWVWCHERGARLGLHTHLLMHVPGQYAPRLGKIICRFLERYTGRALLKDRPDGLVTFKADEPRSARGVIPQKAALEFQGQIIRYMMKGVDPYAMVPAAIVCQHGQDLLSVLKLYRVEDQGQIQGKRCGYSVHNLGKTAFAQVATRLRLAPDEPEYIMAESGFAFVDAVETIRGLRALRIY